MASTLTNKILILGFASILTACASSKVDYLEPDQQKNITTETVIPNDFNHVWDQYVASLSKSIFVINNISKDSRLINVSFSANPPQDYINCGRTKITSKHPSRGTETFNYEVASDSNIWRGIDGTNITVEQKIRTSLNGEANIYIAPQNGETTLVRTNARYLFNISVVETGLTIYRESSSNHTISFASKETGTSSDGIKCYSKGKLEQDLLEIARRLP
ncbi:hypothetical protein [Thalassospira alkalitolerans]|uniref:Lipoprotein n=1 Tax=Thalassospira alkalitolerans TaxID=1293890 RepID=A0A1Y2L9X6_9PROT|nr:hypothetical protein [Thalassospira alkalitolerans]OSQ47104.1 hypothetical protein TALK_13905 [Thalassospira alkalitolerans]